jgi:hypothetical protein
VIIETDVAKLSKNLISVWKQLYEPEKIRKMGGKSQRQADE